MLSIYGEICAIKVMFKSKLLGLCLEFTEKAVTSCSLLFLWKVSMKTAGRSKSKWKSSRSSLLKSRAHL